MKKYLNGVLVDLTTEEQTQRQTQINNLPSAFEIAMMELRAKRNELLIATDWTANSDVTMTAEMTSYRQALRDITNGVDTVEKINAITWPTKP